jgi:hypothetical protein
MRALGATSAGGPGAWTGTRSGTGQNSSGTGAPPVGATAATATAVPAVVVSAPASTVNKGLLYGGLALLAYMMLRKKGRA